MFEFFERITQRSGTHGEITKNAIALLRSLGQTITNDSILVASSNDPDEKITDLWIGHFYGERANTTKGSYTALNIAGKELHAVNNFAAWYQDVLLATVATEKAVELGSALHYIQDLTAPHHFHNLPAKISASMLGWDTHSAFEHRAKELIENTNYLPAATIFFNQLPVINDSIVFAMHVNELALQIAPDPLVLEYETNWDALINQLLPLAIAASARVMKSVL